MIDLPRVVTRDFVMGHQQDTRVPDLLAVHGQIITAGLGHRLRGLLVMSRSVTPAAPARLASP